MYDKNPRHRSTRSGIILLLVLSMLGLFSLLAVSYIVFTSRARTTAASMGFKERRNVDKLSLLEQAEQQAIRGADGPTSSLFGNDMLGDYYGTRDNIINGQIRNAALLIPTVPAPAPMSPIPVEASNNPNSVYLSANERQYPQNVGQVFSYLDGQFLRIPTNLVDNRTWPGWADGKGNRKPADDLACGRYLTMSQGPLTGLTFEIVRSFGDYGSGPQTSGLTGAVILDLTPHLLRDITLVDGSTTTTKTLERWVLDNEVTALFYEKQTAWGQPGTDDNGNGTTDEVSEAGAPGSNDTGFTFTINGQRLNGFGVGISLGANLAMDAVQHANAISIPDGSDTGDTEELVLIGPDTGPSRTEPQIADFASFGAAEFPVALQPHYAMYRSSAAGLPMGDTDEPHDAPDTQNLFLAYFPVDGELGAPTPSFVRPALINYILNEGRQNLTTLPTPQLRAMARALQRSTLRPMPLVDDPLTTNTATNEGVRAFRWDKFTGSNADSRMAGPIEFTLPDSAANSTTLANQLFNFASALATGAWDVDNDGDGIPDSVWVDSGLPLVTMPDGKVVKPMAAYRIEDLGGRLDLNSTGNLAWYLPIDGWRLPNTYFPHGIYPPPTNGHQRNTAAHQVATGGLARASLGATPTIPALPENFPTTGDVVSFRGLGYGPADMGWRTLFFAPGLDPNGPPLVPNLDVNMGLHFGRQMLLRRYGLAAGQFSPGRVTDPFTGNGNDVLGYLRDYAKNPVHQLASRGAPMDVHGRGKVVLDVTGQPLLSQQSATFSQAFGVPTPMSSTFSEVENDPYEIMREATRSPDAAFALDELEAILRQHDWGSASLPQGLKDMVAAEVAGEMNYWGTSAGPGFYNIGAQITVRSSSDSDPVAVLPKGLRGPYTQTGALPPPAQPTNPAFSPATALDWDLFEPHRLTATRLLERLYEAPASAGALENWKRYISIIAPEIRLGRKFNLNRSFANEIDDNSNGMVDESRELNTSPTPSITTSGSNFVPTSVATDHTPEVGPMNMGPLPGVGGKLNLSGNEGRQLYARHLYCLLMLMAKNNENGTKFSLDTFNTGLSADERERLTAWKLAQWAVNAVDFRDPDSVMTGFEFDINPFDGWDVDGDLTTNDANDGFDNNNDGAADDPTEQKRGGVVWGMEAPVLLLTESFNFHDRHVKDTTKDPSGKQRLPPGGQFSDGDPDVDQIRIPEGSTFLELYCIRSPSSYLTPGMSPTLEDADRRANPWGVSRDLFTTDVSGNLVLDLEKLTPPADNDPAHRGNPVWRIGFTKAHNPDNQDATAVLQSPLHQLTTAAPNIRDSITFNPEHLDYLTTPPPPLPVPPTPPTPGAFEFDRVVWFTRQDPTDPALFPYIPADTKRASIYYSRNTNPVRLRTGQYAVVGPRAATNIGSTTADTATMEPAQQRIELTETDINLFDLNGTNVSPGMGSEVRNILGVIAQANAPASWTAGSPRGLNISEPIPDGTYYPEPGYTLNANYSVADAYFSDGATPMGAALDTPLDLAPNRPLTEDFDDPATPENEGQFTGTHEDYKTAYLQRIADPSQPYHPQQNPYITVD